MIDGGSRPFASALRAAVLAALLVGCHGAVRPASPLRENPPASAIPVSQHAFGDSVSHLVRVLAFDAATEQADVYVRQPDNVLVLAVQPGRDIEIIFPGSMTVKQLGANNFQFFMQRFELASRPTDPGADIAARQRYEACMRTQAAIRRTIAQASKPVRDSTGKIISRAPPPDVAEPPPCDLLGAPTGATALYSRAMPPRDPADRYLVVLSSSTPVSTAELEERLGTLTANAPDVALTIEAIAAGIYVGKRGTWGGTFISW